MKKNFVDMPPNMNAIRIPLKNEIRSRAKILTDEAFRETRNYIDVYNEVKNQKSRDFLTNFNKKIGQKTRDKDKVADVDKMVLKTSEIRELLNKISYENFESYSDQILKFSYDEDLLEIFKV
jgi:ERCC4-related helicase